VISLLVGAVATVGGGGGAKQRGRDVEIAKTDTSFG